MVGFIKYVVWVWFEWDYINYNVLKFFGIIQLGWIIVKQFSLGVEKDFCMCIIDEIG